MPEYLALVYHNEKMQAGDDLGPPPSADEVGAAFARMEVAGIAKLH